MTPSPPPPIPGPNPFSNLSFYPSFTLLFYSNVTLYLTETSKKSHFNPKGFFHRSSKKNSPNVPTKVDKKKTPVAPPPTPSPPVPENKSLPSRPPPNPGGKNIFNKFRGEKANEKRNSMALPSLPTDQLDSKRYAVKISFFIFLCFSFLYFLLPSSENWSKSVPLS